MEERWIDRVEERLPALYLAVALVVCGVLCLVTAPFFGPDEANQACRAISLSHGSVVEQMGADEAGGPVDSGALAAMEGVNAIRMRWEKSGSDYHNRPYGPIGPGSLSGLEKMQWSGQAVFVPFGNTAPYPPFLYVPSAVGWRMGEALGLSIFWSLRLARLLCALSAVALGWTSLRIAPNIRWLLLPYLLLPTVLFYNATCSQDSILLGVAALVVALVARAVEAGREMSLAETAAASTLLALIAMARPPYGALALVLFIPTLAQGGQGWRRWLRPFAGFDAVVTAMLTWHRLVEGLGFDTADDANPDLQGAFVFAHPLAAMEAVVRGTAEAAWDLCRRGTYVLGWNDLLAPAWLRWAAGLSLVAAALGSRGFRLKGPGRVGLAAAGGFALVGISAAEYIIWTPPGLGTVYGIMPRYWLPALPVLMLAVSGVPMSEEMQVRLRTGVLALSFLGALSLPFVASRAFYLQGLLVTLQSL